MLSMVVASNTLQSNRQYAMEFVGNLLLSSFPNLTKAQVGGFVSGLLSSDTDLNTFKLHLRDFLVTLKVQLEPCLVKPREGKGGVVEDG